MREIICHGCRKLALLGIIKVQKAHPVAIFPGARSIRLFLMKMDEAHRYIETSF